MQTPGTPEITDEKEPACIGCGSSDVLKGYPNALCGQCRQNMIRYPVPVWVKLFGGAVMIIMLGSLISFPHELTAGIHLKRGEKAEERKKYVTAGKEFEKVAAGFPGSTDAKGHLMIASFYNMDYDAFAGYATALSKQHFDNKDLSWLHRQFFLARSAIRHCRGNRVA